LDVMIRVPRDPALTLGGREKGLALIKTDGIDAGSGPSRQFVYAIFHERPLYE
jgi:hypothetical protein